MSQPFVQVPADAPFELVFEQLNPVITNAHGRIRSLGDTISGGCEKTRQAMVEVLESAQHEVAVASLLSGANTIMLSYRAAMEPLGASLRTQVDTAHTAWRAYGANGCWEPPPHAAPPSTSIRSPRIQIEAPRVLAEGEYITEPYTECVIDVTAQTATNVGQAGREFFANALRAPIPLGPLMDFVDTATAEHAQVFATLHTELAETLHDYIGTVQASYVSYHQTGLWANPAVAHDAVC